MKLVLERILATAHGTVGLLHTPSGFVPFTLEEEDRGNAVGVSSIPAGAYAIRRTVWHKTGAETFEILNVPGRSRILFHWGNTEEASEGCILFGLSLGVLAVDRDEESGLPAKKLAVLQSRKAFDRFMDLMKGVDEAELEITAPVPS